LVVQNSHLSGSLLIVRPVHVRNDLLRKGRSLGPNRVPDNTGSQVRGDAGGSFRCGSTLFEVSSTAHVDNCRRNRTSGLDGLLEAFLLFFDNIGLRAVRHDILSCCFTGVFSAGAGEIRLYSR
jgi:hypothetical protein